VEGEVEAPKDLVEKVEATAILLKEMYLHHWRVLTNQSLVQGHANWSSRMMKMIICFVATDVTSGLVVTELG
jgi:hypothetical protein